MNNILTWANFIFPNWSYFLNNDLSLSEEVSEDKVWENIRAYRNRLLADSDWTQVDDAPVNKAVWANYRQFLRDLPNTYKDNPMELVFPIVPE
jgi:hypothetical protein